MIDYHRLIDSIRNILASPYAAPLDSVSRTSAEYAEACEAVNDRLRKCGDLLREGLRSEAIQQCEMEPNLLSLVSTLDFPELSDWFAMLQAHGLLIPDSLLMDVAADLNEAYSQEQPLAAVLRRHRLLALGRSPLRERVFTLRKLAKLDSNNPAWQDDLRTYERARQQEIRRTAEQDYRRGNAVALEESSQDLERSDWLEPPAPALVEQVTGAYTRLMSERARSELGQLEPQLNDAFAQFDVERGRVLRDRWNACVTLTDLSEEDDLHHRAAPALEWLDEQDQNAESEAGYQAAVTALEAALDEEESLAVLERLAHAALRYDRALPSLIDQRYRNRVAGLELTRSRRSRLIVAATAVVLLIVSFAIGLVVFRHNQEEQIAANVHTVQAYLTQHLFDEAQKHLDQLMESAPGIAMSEPLQALKVELANQFRLEQERRVKFDRAIEAAEAAGVDQPDRTAAEQARKLAILDAEKVRVLKLETAIAAADRDGQKKRDEEFVGLLNNLKASADKLDRNSPNEQVLTSLRLELAALVRKSSDISGPVLAQSKVLEARLDAMHKEKQRTQQMNDALAMITSRLGDPVGFKLAIDGYVTAFPESARAVDFKRITGEISLWKTIDTWNRFLKTWRTEDVTHLDAAQAKKRLADCNDLLRDQGSCPDANELRRRLPYLEAIARRVDDAGAKLQGPLSELFTDPLVANLWMVEILDDHDNLLRYYLTAAPPEVTDTQSSFQITYIVDFTRTATQKHLFPIKWVKYRGPAPQSTVAKAALDEMAKMDNQSWEPTFFKIVRSIVSNDRLEPMLKVLFLQKVVDVAGQGSESMRLAFTQYQGVLTSVAIDSAVPWMDPKNEDARRARAIAVDQLKRLPDLTHIREEAAKNFKMFKVPPGDAYTWVGWLARETDGTWLCRTADQNTADGDLCVAQPAAIDTPVPASPPPTATGFSWSKIGHIKANKVAIDASGSLNQIEGRPVYLRLDRRH